MRFAIEFALAWCLLLGVFASGGSIYVAGAFAAAVALTVPRNINGILSLLGLSRVRFLTLLTIPTFVSATAAIIYWFLAPGLRDQWYQWIPLLAATTLMGVSASIAAGYPTLRKGISALNS